VCIMPYLCKSLTSSSALVLSRIFGGFFGSSLLHVSWGNGQLGCPWWEKHPPCQHPPRFLACEMWPLSWPPQAAGACPCPGQCRDGAGGEGPRAASRHGDGTGAAMLLLVGRSSLALRSCSQKPGKTEPRRILYFRGSDVQILCKALHDIAEPCRPPRIDVTS